MSIIHLKSTGSFTEEPAYRSTFGHSDARTSWLAKLSVVVGLLSLCLVAFASGLSLLAAVACGHLARRSGARSDGSVSDCRIALGGLVLGYALVLLGLGRNLVASPDSRRPGVLGAMSHTHDRNPASLDAEQDGSQTAPSVIQSISDLDAVVSALTFSPDNRWLAIGQRDRSLRLLDVTSGETISEHGELSSSGAVTALRFAEDARRLFVGGETGRIAVWHLDEQGTLTPAHELRGHRRPIRCLSCSRSAEVIVSGDVGGEIIWQQSSAAGKSRSLKAFQSAVQAIHLPTRGVDMLASDGAQLLTINLRHVQVVRSIVLERSPSDVVAFSPDGTEIASGRGRRIRIWQTRTGEQRSQLEDERQTQWSALYAPNSRMLLSGGSGRFTAWDLESSQIGELFPMEPGYVKTLAVSPNGRLVAAVGHSPYQTLRVVRLRSTIVVSARQTGSVVRAH